MYYIPALGANRARVTSTRWKKKTVPTYAYIVRSNKIKDVIFNVISVLARYRESVLYFDCRVLITHNAAGRALTRRS